MFVESLNPESGFPEAADTLKECAKLWEKCAPEGLKDLLDTADKLNNGKADVESNISEHMAEAVLRTHLTSKQDWSSFYSVPLSASLSRAASLYQPVSSEYKICSVSLPLYISFACVVLKVVAVLFRLLV